MHNPEHEILQGNNETILLVDDNLDIIETTRYALEMLNYNVLTASNGQEAIDVFQTQGNIDLFLLDVMMPIMGGVEFAEWVLSRKPHAKFIFHTGSDLSNELDAFIARYGTRVIIKPSPILKLSHTIREVLSN